MPATPALVALHLSDALAGAVALGLGHCGEDGEHQRFAVTHSAISNATTFKAWATG
jgi:hypothetical protein